MTKHKIAPQSFLCVAENIYSLTPKEGEKQSHMYGHKLRVQEVGIIRIGYRSRWFNGYVLSCSAAPLLLKNRAMHVLIEGEHSANM